jgi:hypothetical protein
MWILFFACPVIGQCAYTFIELPSSSFTRLGHLANRDAYRTGFSLGSSVPGKQYACRGSHRGFLRSSIETIKARIEGLSP